MLDHLQQHVIELLAPIQVATLSTCGPAGIQAEILPCEALGMSVYLLVPGTSEHLYNLEGQSSLVVTTNEWQLNGAGRVLMPSEAPDGLTLLKPAQSCGCLVIEVKPIRLQVGSAGGRGFSETIDFPEQA